MMIFKREHRKPRHASVFFVDERIQKSFDKYEDEMTRTDWPRTKGQAIAGAVGVAALFFVAIVFMFSL